MADVLIVDGSPMCRELLGRILEVHGYAVDWSPPEDAAKQLNKAVPDVLILDPGVSDSQGWRLLAELYRKGASVKSPSPRVVIVTDQAGRDDILRAAKMGVRDYMLKNRFSIAELLVRMQQYTKGRSNIAVATPQKEANPGGGSAPPVQNAPVAPVSGANVQAGSTGAVVRTAVAPTAARPPVTDKENFQMLTEAARELAIVPLTREETLQKLDTAPAKTLPGVVSELISLVNSPRGTVGDVAVILRRDPVMTARVLRVANSASFTSQRARVANVEDAVKNIGVTGVRNLVVNVGIFDAFSTDATGSLRLTRVWQHCLGVAMLMEKLAPKDPSVPPGSAYLVGLCHDLADIVLRQHLAVEYKAVEALQEKTACLVRAAEGFVFGMPYAELVCYLLTRLGLPPLITLPIEEFFDRGRLKGAAGAGSLLARALRAMNVYAHGLMLAPGIVEPITPLTRSECANAFGDATLSKSDDEQLRGEALSTASILAGLSSTQTQQMCDLLVPRQPIKLCYSRHSEYSSLDPLAGFLRLASREVSVLAPLAAVTPDLLAGADALIVAGPRNGAAEVFAQEQDRIARLIAARPIPVLHLTGSLGSATATQSGKTSLSTLPISIESLGQFLVDISDKQRAL